MMHRSLFVLFLLLISPVLAQATPGHGDGHDDDPRTCAAHDTACLIDAFHQANDGEPLVVRLEAGTYPLTAVDNEDGAEGPNALPRLTGTLTLRGAGPGATALLRPQQAPQMRLLFVGPTGTLLLEDLALVGGEALSNGGAIHNEGTVSLTRVDLRSHSALTGGALWNTGVLLMQTSACRLNAAEILGGCLVNLTPGYAEVDSVVFDSNSTGLSDGAYISTGILVMRNSFCTRNVTDISAGCGSTGGNAHIQDTVVSNNLTSTYAGGMEIFDGAATYQRVGIIGNVTAHGGGGVLALVGQLRLVGSVVSGNRVGFPGGEGGGIDVWNPTLTDVTLVHSTVFANEADVGPDCHGTVRSVGNTTIGNPAGCTVE